MLSFAVLLASAAACTTNHDSLARKPTDNKGGGGAGGIGGTAGLGSGNTGNQAQGGRYNPDFEPPGDNVLTVVNGVVDAPSIRLCFARVEKDGTSEIVGSPSPELAYGASLVLTEIEGLSLVEDTIQTWAITGELSKIEKLDCSEAVARAEAEEARVTPIAALENADGAGGAPSDVDSGGAGGQVAVGAGGEGTAGAGGAGEEPPLEKPRLRARAAPAVPPATVNIGRSILMVLTGCIGGAAYSDRAATSACGDPYTPDSPTLQPIVVTLSRQIAFDKVGLQAVHASLSTPSLDLRTTGADDAVALVFASSVAYGSIEPRPADTRFTKLELGVDRTDYGLQAINEDGAVAFAEDWPSILARSGIDAIQSARTYTAIFLGPDPQLIKQGFWSRNAFALVDNDPTRK